MRYFLPTYLFAYCGAAFVWRAFVVWRRTGINPVVFKGSDGAHGFIGRSLVVLFALVVMVVLAFSFWPSAYQYTLTIDWLARPWSHWIGVFLLLLSLGWTMVAQAQMGESWRVGIDERSATPLVQAGVFRWSRNPIFLGMMVTLLGLFLVIPNGLTLFALIAGGVLIRIQVRLEEGFLTRTQGKSYDDYRQRVRRWI